MSVDVLILGYINRGLMSDNFDEHESKQKHSEEFLKEVDDALGL